MAGNWYVVQVMSGWEQKVKRTFDKMIPAEGMDKYISRVLVPEESVAEVKGGKKTVTKRKFFPGYVLMEMELTDEVYYFVNQVNGVIRFAGESKPVPLLDYEVEGILGQLEGKDDKVKPKVHFEKGEAIKVIDGPFVNFNGVVEEVHPEKGKLRAMCYIFGRATSVELEYWQVERI